MNTSDLLRIIQQYRPWPIALADRVKVYPKGRPLGLTVLRGKEAREVCIESGARDVVRLNEIFGTEQYLSAYPDAKNRGSSHKTVVMDIGANKGFFTLYASLLFGESMFAYCYEPSSSNLPYLHMNIDRNKLQAEIIPVAVHSSESLQIVLYEADSPGHHTTLTPQRIHQAADTPPVLTGREMSVPARNISNEIRKLLVEHGKIDILKVDVEGAEIDLLSSVEEDLWEGVQYFVAEVWRRQQVTEEFAKCWTRLDRHFVLHKWNTFIAGTTRAA